jgi:hypothetical protein
MDARIDAYLIRKTCREKDSIVSDSDSLYTHFHMKRTSKNLKLKRRLELVRTTVRELSPASLEQVHGGNASLYNCPTKCCPYTDN